MRCEVWETKSKAHRVKSLRDRSGEDRTGGKNIASVFAKRLGQGCADPWGPKDRRKVAFSAKSFSFSRMLMHIVVHFKSQMPLTSKAMSRLAQGIDGQGH